MSSDGGYTSYQVHATNAEELGVPATKKISPHLLRSRSPSSVRRYPVEKWVPNELDRLDDPDCIFHEDIDGHSGLTLSRNRARSISFDGLPVGICDI